MEDLTGKQLKQYQIISPLGEGGMAAVYKAYQLGKMNRYVALKILPQQLAKSPEFVKRFDQEANVLAQLQHPRILPVFDFGESDGYTYLAMPFIEGGTLADLLQGKPLPLPQIRSFIVQIAEALDYAHSRGLIHRDVKPSNVLVDERGNCLLSDFGITKILEGAEKLTATGGIIGTPAYMSPEQGRGENVDQRSDIYSLGVMLFEMATGRVPFKAETPLAVMIKHMQSPLPPPRSINPALPEAVEQVIFMALAKNREDRYLTASELGRAIQAAIPDIPSSPLVETDTLKGDTATPTTALFADQGPRTQIKTLANKPKTMPRWNWAIIGFVVLLIIFGSLIAVFGKSVDSIASSTATIQSTIMSISTSTSVPTVTATVQPTSMPTASQAPNVSLEDFTDKTLIGEDDSYSVFLLIPGSADAAEQTGELIIYDKNKQFVYEILGTFTLFGKTIVSHDGKGEYVLLSTGTYTLRTAIVISLNDKRQVVNNFCIATGEFGSHLFWDGYIIFNNCDVFGNRPWGAGEAPGITAINLKTGLVIDIAKSDLTHQFQIQTITDNNLQYLETSVEKEEDWQYPDKQNTMIQTYNLLSLEN